MSGKNNLVTITQWNEILRAVSKNRCDTYQPKDTMYVGEEKLDRYKVNETRYFCYDKYDRHDILGLDLIIKSNDIAGELTVYNGSVQARAPVTFEQGKQIAQSFFDEKGSNIAKEIVSEWVMSGNAWRHLIIY